MAIVKRIADREASIMKRLDFYINRHGVPKVSIDGQPVHIPAVNSPEEMPRMVATTYKWEGEVFTLTYHQTDVFTFDRETGIIVLDHGGYPTATTTKRINQAAQIVGVDILAFRRKVNGKWEVFVETPGGKVLPLKSEYPFREGWVKFELGD